MKRLCSFPVGLTGQCGREACDRVIVDMRIALCDAHHDELITTALDKRAVEEER